MPSEPQPVDSPARQPANVAKIENVPPQMTGQTYAIPGHQNVQEACLLSDQPCQHQERQAAVEERVAMAAYAQQPDIQVWEDRAEIARNEGREKNADRLTDIGPVAGACRHIA